MYSAAALLDVHTRSHRSLVKLLDHCDAFSDVELARELEGFGCPSIAHQLHHGIGAERYWVSVVNGQMRVDEDPANMASISALRAFRETVAGATAEYLRGASDAELNTPRTMMTWGEHERELVPAHVIMRTQTHIFQHQGQIAAMCRLLGKPIPPGLDFPLL